MLLKTPDCFYLSFTATFFCPSPYLKPASVAFPPTSLWEVRTLALNVIRVTDKSVPLVCLDLYSSKDVQFIKTMGQNGTLLGGGH